MITLVVTLSLLGAPEEVDQNRIDFFEKKIRPLLVEHCYRCHSARAKKVRGDLRLDTRSGWQKGGTRGAALVPGKPDESLLIQAIRYEDPDLEMPPAGKLSKEEIALLTEWVQRGAPDPRTGAAPPPAQEIDIEKGRDFWSFRSPRRPVVPEVRDAGWPQSDIDRFILARMEKSGLTPTTDASAETLVRRAYFDLVGLPSPAPEVARFAQTPTRVEFARLIDRLLASPRYGERWGRHWLDVARFAESSGGGRSFMYKNAWRYRDYVIAAFNSDKPYDHFIREQVAGDLLPAASPEERDEHLTATAFLALGPTNYELQDKELLRMEVIDEQISTVGRAFLGLTLGCARCHDHKFDPIPTSDYYALAGIFRSTKSLRPGNVSGYVERQLYTSAAHREALDSYAAKLSDTEKRLNEAKEKHRILKEKAGKTAREKPTEVDDAGALEAVEKTVERLAGEIKELNAHAPEPAPMTMSVDEDKEPRDWYIHLRGGVRDRGPGVRRGFLQVVSSPKRPALPVIPPGQSGRLQLAHWIADPDNPLTARVAVNRIWQHLLGTGLVRTPDNFGLKGEVPSHPELLDHLALRLIERRWSIKAIIREIMLSRVYQLSTRSSTAADPGNRLLSRANRKRLDAECIRDALLVVSGKLNPKAGGPTIRKFSLYDMGYKFDTTRRSVYVPAFRNAPLEILQVFDRANPNVVTGKRSESTLPTQALYLMNSPFVQDRARDAARLLLAETRDQPELRLDIAYLRALGRRPTAGERDIALLHLEATSNAPSDAADLEAWTMLFHALFASLDFRYLN